MFFHKTPILNPFILVVSLLAVSLLLSACKDEDGKAKSSPRDREIQIDGNDGEWQGVPQFYDEKSRTVISFLHDEHYLFMRLASNDRQLQRQVLVFGLTIWFEQPDEGNRKTGVHFPVGLPREERMAMFHRPPLDNKDSTNGSPHRKEKFSEKALKEIQLWGPHEYEQKTMLLKESGKYDVAVSVSKIDRNLIYELKVPFVPNDGARFGLVHPGKQAIRVGFQAGDREKTKERNMGHQTPNGNESPEGRKGRGKPGGMGGKMGGGRGGHGADGNGEKPQGQSIEPLVLWVNLTLANAGHQE